MSIYGNDASVSGSLVVTGSATFNDKSGDFDFIVESDGNTHMLFVDAGNDKVGIGTSSPDYTLDVAGNIGLDQYIYHNGDANTLINFADDKIILKAGGKAMITMEEKASSPHEVTINDGSNNIDFVVKGNGSNQGNPGLKFDADTNKLGINGIGTPAYELEVAGNIGLAEYIYHRGDDDTFIRFEDDIITLEAGGRAFIKLEEANQDKVIINPGVLNVDLKVGGENNANLIRTDAANDRVGINTGTPSATLHVSSSGDTSLIVEGKQDVALGLVADIDNAGGENQNPYLYMSQETATAGAYQFLMGLEGTANLSYTGSYTNQPFILSLNSEAHSSLRTFQIATADGGDVSSRFSIATGGRIAIGDAVQAADARLHVKEAAGDIFKMENTTAYGMTYGQLVKQSLTLTDGGSPLDTTLNLPAASMITDVLITIKTAGAGDAHTIDNVALTYGGSTSNIKGSSFSGLSLISNPSQGVAAGTQYVVGNTDQSFPAGRATMLLAGAADIKLVYTDTNITTEPVVDVVVFYKKFDTT